LRHWQVQRVVMESTSTYWKGVYYLLEAEGFDCWLVNAREVKNVPGRAETDLLTELPQGFGAGACREGFGWLGWLLGIGDGDLPRDLAVLVVPGRGGLEVTGDLFQPYRLVDAEGAVVAPVAAYFAELTACGRPATTQRSYGMDLLRWFRFLWALGVAWDQATRVEARDSVAGCRSRTSQSGHTGGARTVMLPPWRGHGLGRG